MADQIPLGELQARATSHHREQFGLPTLSVRGLKVGEEAGEVQGALVRHLSRRDGRSWSLELRSEIGDLMVATLMLANGLGMDLQTVTEEAVERFCSRTWEVDKDAGEAE